MMLTAARTTGLRWPGHRGPTGRPDEPLAAVAAVATDSHTVDRDSADVPARRSHGAEPELVTERLSQRRPRRLFTASQDHRMGHYVDLRV